MTSDALPDPILDEETEEGDEFEEVVLADLRWDLGPGGGGSPGNDDSGRVVLTRSRDGYYVLQISADDFRRDPLAVADDDAAIARFQSGFGTGGVIVVYTRNRQ